MKVDDIRPSNIPTEVDIAYVPVPRIVLRGNTQGGTGRQGNVHQSIGPVGAQIAHFGANFELAFEDRIRRGDSDGTSLCITAVQGVLRAAKNFNSGDVKKLTILRALRNRDAVDEHGNGAVIGRQWEKRADTANVRYGAAPEACVDEIETGNGSSERPLVVQIPAPDVLSIEHTDSERHFPERLLDLPGRYDNGVEHQRIFSVLFLSVSAERRVLGGSATGCPQGETCAKDGLEQQPPRNRDLESRSARERSFRTWRRLRSFEASTDESPISQQTNAFQKRRQAFSGKG